MTVGILGATEEVRGGTGGDAVSKEPGRPVARGDADAHDDAEAGGVSFLLVQLGVHAAGMFAARLAPLGLEPRQFGVLNRLAAAEGKSQQAIAQQLGLNTTRMVFLVDELERLGLAERRRNPADRRSHALYLTSKGRQTLGQARMAVAQHEALLCSSLTADDRRQLATQLRRLADGLGIRAGGLPGGGRPPEC